MKNGKNWKRICWGKIRKIWLGIVLFSIFSVFFNLSAGRVFLAADLKKEMFFTLTKEEEDYLDGLRAAPLSLGICEERMWSEEESGYGLASPLLDVLHYEFGLEIEIVQGTWKKNTAALSAGELDFLFGVPAVLPEENLYFSEWLYKNPHMLIEYTEEIERDIADESEENVNKKQDTAKTIVAYVAKHPASEMILPHLSHFLDGEIEFFPCKNESAVFRALKNGSADFGLVSEEALFSRYPAENFSLISKIYQYGNTATLSTAQEKYRPLLEILDRYLDTQEGEGLREAIGAQQQNIRWATLRKKEEKIIKELQGRGEFLFYAKGGFFAVPFFWQEDVDEMGILLEFLSFVKESTGLILKRDSRSGESALQALEDGEILFVAGVQLPSDQDKDFVPCQKQRIVPVIPVEKTDSADGNQKETKGKKGQEDIACRYWGAVSELMPLFDGTAFDGHTVEFVDEEVLCQAIEEGEIGGMLIAKESFDAMLLSGERAYTVVEEIAFPVKSGLKFAESDPGAELFSRLWKFYECFLLDMEEIGNPFSSALTKMGERETKLLFAFKIAGATALVFMISFLFALCAGRKQKKK